MYCRFFKDYSLDELALEVFRRYSTHLVATDDELPDIVRYIGVESVRALLLKNVMSRSANEGAAEEVSVATVVLRMVLQWLQQTENEGRIHLLGATNVCESVSRIRMCVFQWNNACCIHSRVSSRRCGSSWRCSRWSTCASCAASWSGSGGWRTRARGPTTTRPSTIPRCRLRRSTSHSSSVCPACVRCSRSAPVSSSRRTCNASAPPPSCRRASSARSGGPLALFTRTVLRALVLCMHHTFYCIFSALFGCTIICICICIAT